MNYFDTGMDLLLDPSNVERDEQLQFGRDVCGALAAISLAAAGVLILTRPNIMAGAMCFALAVVYGGSAEYFHQQLGEDDQA